MLLVVQVDAEANPAAAELYRVKERELPCMRTAATEPHTVQESRRVGGRSCPFSPCRSARRRSRNPMTAEGLLAFAAAHRNGWTARSPSPGAPHE